MDTHKETRYTRDGQEKVFDIPNGISNKYIRDIVGEYNRKNKQSRRHTKTYKGFTRRYKEVSTDTRDRRGLHRVTDYDFRGTQEFKKDDGSWKSFHIGSNKRDRNSGSIRDRLETRSDPDATAIMDRLHGQKMSRKMYDAEGNEKVFDYTVGYGQEPDDALGSTIKGSGFVYTNKKTGIRNSSARGIKYRSYRGDGNWYYRSDRDRKNGIRKWNDEFNGKQEYWDGAGRNEFNIGSGSKQNRSGPVGDYFEGLDIYDHLIEWNKPKVENTDILPVPETKEPEVKKPRLSKREEMLKKKYGNKEDYLTGIQDRNGWGNLGMDQKNKMIGLGDKLFDENYVDKLAPTGIGVQKTDDVAVKDRVSKRKQMLKEEYGTKQKYLDGIQGKKNWNSLSMDEKNKMIQLGEELFDEVDGSILNI